MFVYRFSGYLKAVWRFYFWERDLSQKESCIDVCLKRFFASHNKGKDNKNSKLFI